MVSFFSVVIFFMSIGLVVLFDLTDYGWSNFALDDTKTFLDGLQHRLPIRQSAIYVINAPWIINSILTLVTTFLSEKIRGKIRFCLSVPT
jgi:hypothetical protein